MEVRDYEVDRFGVVNNAVYANYLHHVRDAFLRSEGVDVALIVEGGNLLALTELHIKYLQPLRSLDKFRATLTIRKLTSVRAEFEHKLIRVESDSPQVGSPTLLLLVAW
ncbi:hypothetical protein WJX72_007068 [[Myrmecia] bisecta]|uniref:Thioesterase domain-containing protein n=1 Tax=[Myrmecia] bisecta TaxID=41462 RepID=A0AAW1QFE5_9CHLO